MSSEPAPERLTATEELLKLLENPFVGQQLQQNSLYTSFGTSIGFTVFIAICFSFLRPYNQAVYAPKLKHADDRHAPPPVSKKLWGWLMPLWSLGEAELVQHVGMDATIFLRFTRMCRNMFLVLSLLGCCVFIPLHLTNSDTPVDGIGESKWLDNMTPRNVWEAPIWGQVVVAWLFNFIIAGFLWWNYRKVMGLRRWYFESEDYRHSLHARTLMMYDIPKQKCSDEGLASIIDEVVPSASFARTAIARNVRDLPDLIKQHDETVRALEKVLAKYLKYPSQLPAERPKCKPDKKDPSFGTYHKNQKLDAIDYLTDRIKSLEVQIKEVRQSVDKRTTMPYGFASYTDIAEAHSIAYASQGKKPHGATIRLAPLPSDIIWDNMPLAPQVRKTRRIFNIIWVSLLTLLWIAPNAMIAIFLVNLGNLGKVWPEFQRTLEANTGFWGAVQGILSPALLSLFYLLLPIIFRRLAVKAGDQTKTGRERHVVGKLYSFFVFNNLLIFTFFSTIWAYIAGFIDRANRGDPPWDFIQVREFADGLFLAMCTISSFWVTWLLQRQLGAAIDLAQLWPLVYGFFMKKFASPTPRQLIELTAPPTFDYASYYNYFLFYSTVALFYAGIQPLVLPAAALYFCIDVFLKKYLILYIFVTKTESGGLFWRTLFNRFIAAVIFADCVVFLTCWVRGFGDHIQAFCVVPLPFLMLAFKYFCAKSFDDKIKFVSTRDPGTSHNPEAGLGKESRLRSERLAARFGHPALYKSLITPMVHQKAQNMLHVVYKGRVSEGRTAAGGASDAYSVSGYSDAYILDSMAAGKVGKAAQSVPGFEFVAESQLDFEHYKNRSEFASEHGGQAMYGGSTPDRPGTPSSMFESEAGSRPGTPSGFQSRRAMALPKEGEAYGQRPPSSGTFPATAYQPSALREQPLTTAPLRGHSALYSQGNDSSSGLVVGAESMARGLSSSSSRDASMDMSRIGTPMGATARRTGGYANVPQEESEIGPHTSLMSPGIVSPRVPSPRVASPGPQGSPRIMSPVPMSPPSHAPGQAPGHFDYFRGSERRPGEGSRTGTPKPGTPGPAQGM